MAEMAQSDDSLLKEEINKEQNAESTTPETEVVTISEEPATNTTVETSPTIADTGTIVSDPGALAPVPAHPHANAHPAFLPGVHDVHPMQANYVSSYGVLPTRFAKDGPFLYSLPVNPKIHRDHHRSDDD